MAWVLGSAWRRLDGLSSCSRHNTHRSVFSLTLTSISGPGSWARGKHASKGSGMLGSTAIAWDGYGLSSRHPPRLARDLRPSTRSQRSPQSSNYSSLPPRPSREPQAGRGGCALCVLPSGQHPALPHNTSQSRIRPEKCLLEKPPCLPVLSQHRASIGH